MVETLAVTCAWCTPFVARTKCTS